jgi:hypothetical protein
LFLWRRRAGANDAQVVCADFSKNDQAQPAIPQVSDDDLARFVL